MAKAKKRPGIPRHQLRLYPRPLSEAPDDDLVMDGLLALCNGENWTFDPGKDRGTMQTTAEATALRPRFVALLDIAVRDLKELSKTCLPMVYPLLEQIQMKPAIEVSKVGWRLTFERILPTFEVSLTYGVILLLDHEKEYGEALSKCQLSSCGHFYFATRNPKGGPPNRTYCCPEHRTKSNNQLPRKRK